RPLSAAEKDAYWEETKRFATLFGIPEELVPADWTAFRRYWDGMLASDVIRVSPTARDLADVLLRTPAWWLGPAWQWRRGITARLPPPRLRAEFGLAFGPLECAVSETSIAALRAGWWLLPGSLRYLPAYREAERRVGGRTPVGAIVDQLVDQFMDRLRDRLVWLARGSPRSSFLRLPEGGAAGRAGVAGGAGAEAVLPAGARGRGGWGGRDGGRRGDGA